jgi:hypothetical protein
LRRKAAMIPTISEASRPSRRAMMNVGNTGSSPELDCCPGPVVRVP